MKPANRLFLFLLLIFFIVSGTAPAVNAQDCTSITAGTIIDNAQEVSCGVVDPICYSGSILGATKPPQVDYYKINLVAGQELIIDVDAADAETIDSNLDALLEVVETDGTPVDASNDPILDPNDPSNVSLDPYLEVSAPADGDITYVLAISAGSDDPTDGDDLSTSGPYTFSLQCSDPSVPPVPVESVDVGDLLGSTGSVKGSLVTIADGKSTFRFPMGSEPIADLEYSYGDDIVFFATQEIPSSINTINPNNGDQGEPFNFDSQGFFALESAESELYGVMVEFIQQDDYTEIPQYSLVIIDPVAGSVLPVVKLEWQIRGLAYHSTERVIYAVASIQNDSDLVKIRLEPELSIETASAIPILDDITGQVKVVALDFDHENVLYGVDGSGNLLKIDHVSGKVLESTPIESSDGVNGLTFVVGEPPDVEPIKIICSSTLTSPVAASSQATNTRFRKFKRKRNPLHRAVGLFRFEGKAFENITLRLAPEAEEPVEAVEESWVSKLKNSWLRWKWRGKGRVFLGIRDAIPDVEFRVRKKDKMPFEMSAVLPEDGTYYIMVIRPLLRYHKTDYCLTLESNYEDSEAWKTLEVAWPSDDSAASATSTSTEAKTAEVQSDKEADDGASGSDDPNGTDKSTETLDGEPEENNDQVPVTLSTSAVTPTSVSLVETTVGETDEVRPEVPPAVSLMNPDDEQDDGEELQPVEETTVDETDEVKPEESVDEITGDDESGDGSDSEEVDEELPIETSTP